MDETNPLTATSSGTLNTTSTVIHPIIGSDEEEYYEIFSPTGPLTIRLNLENPSGRAIYRAYKAGLAFGLGGVILFASQWLSSVDVDKWVALPAVGAASVVIQALEKYYRDTRTPKSPD